MAPTNEPEISKEPFSPESWSDPIRMKEASEEAESIMGEDPLKGLTLAGDALRIARALGDMTFVARTLRTIGRGLILTSDYRQSIDRLREGERASEECGEDQIWIDIQYLIGTASAHLGDYQTAAERFTAGLERAEAIGWEDGCCSGLNNLGILAFRTHRYDEALVVLEQSCEIARRTENREAEARGIRNIGSVREHQGELARAITCYSQGLEIFTELGLSSELPGLYNDIAGAWCRIGEFPRAFEAYRSAHEGFTKLGNTKGIAFVLNNLGHLYLDLGQLDQALEHFRESLALKEELGIDHILLSTLRNIAGILVTQHQFEAARRELERCDRLCERLADDFLTAQLRNNWGHFYAESDEPEEAIISFTEALDLFERIGASDRGAEVRIELGRLLWRTSGTSLSAGREGDPSDSGTTSSARESRSNSRREGRREKEAIEFLEGGLQIGVDLDLKDIQADAHEALSSLHNDRGEFREALHHYRRAQELRQEFSSAEGEERLQHLMILYDLERERQGRKIAEQQSEIRRLENVRLEQDIEFRSKELATTAMYLTRKNDLLRKVRRRLDRFGEELDAPQKKEIREVLSAIDQELNSDDSWGTFEEQFRLVHATFLEQLARSYPPLSPVELKVCALIKAGLSIKETAQILNTESRSVETYRGRIRKKLHLERNDNLATFLARFG